MVKPGCSSADSHAMIAFGVHVASEPVFARHLAPALARVAEPDSAIFEATGETVVAAYAEIVEAARELAGLEALVLLREDAEPADPRLPQLLREAFADPAVALVGVAGG